MSQSVCFKRGAYPLVIVGLTAAGLLVNGLAIAKDPPSDDTKGKAVKAKADADAPKGRLPAHYADLVDADQKAKIYQIQADHEPAIKKLREELKTAIEKRNKAIEGVLTTSQKEKLAALVAGDKAKGGKAAKSEEMESADEDEPAEAPPAKGKAKANS